MTNFSAFTMAGLQEMKDALNAEISKRQEQERKIRMEELKTLLERVNQLQDEYEFEISCRDECYDWVSSAFDFEVKE